MNARCIAIAAVLLVAGFWWWQRFGKQLLQKR